jgi:hypothetical protein
MASFQRRALRSWIVVTTLIICWFVLWYGWKPSAHFARSPSSTTVRTSINLPPGLKGDRVVIYEQAIHDGEPSICTSPACPAPGLNLPNYCIHRGRRGTSIYAQRRRTGSSRYRSVFVGAKYRTACMSNPYPLSPITASFRFGFVDVLQNMHPEGSPQAEPYRVESPYGSSATILKRLEADSIDYLVLSTCKWSVPWNCVKALPWLSCFDKTPCVN